MCDNKASNKFKLKERKFCVANLVLNKFDQSEKEVP